MHLILKLSHWCGGRGKPPSKFLDQEARSVGLISALSLISWWPCLGVSLLLLHSMHSLYWAGCGCLDWFIQTTSKVGLHRGTFVWIRNTCHVPWKHVWGCPRSAISEVSDLLQLLLALLQSDFDSTVWPDVCLCLWKVLKIWARRFPSGAMSWKIKPQAACSGESPGRAAGTAIPGAALLLGQGLSSRKRAPPQARGLDFLATELE